MKVSIILISLLTLFLTYFFTQKSPVGSNQRECKLFGQTEAGYNTVVEVQSKLNESDIKNAKRIESADGVCQDDEFKTESATSKDGKVKLSLVANVCGSSDVYWFAKISSESLFPVTKIVSLSLSKLTSDRVLLGEERSEDFNIRVDGKSYKFLYLDCQPLKK